MDVMSSKDGCFNVDLEKGVVGSELGSSGGHNFDTSVMNQLDSVTPSVGIGNCKGSNCIEGSDNVNLNVVDKRVGEERGGDVVEKKILREKPKVMSAKKPPRPPRGLSLDLADQKLIRELHEIAKLKRARNERMKALKKAKEAKNASSKNHIFATLLTVLFCIVLLYQGISSRTTTNSGVSFQGSPVSSRLTKMDSVISIQQSPTSSATTVNQHDSRTSRYSPISFASNLNRHDSDSSRLMVSVSGSDIPELVSTAVS